MRTKMPHAQDAVKFIKNLFAGASSAMVAKTVMAPIERVKLILQLQTAQKTIQVNLRYRGLLDCLLRIPKEQGFASFWRGNVVNLMRACSQESLGFAFKDFFKIWCISSMDGSGNRWRFVMGNIAAGGASGMATYSLIYPLEFARTRLAVDMGKEAGREFNGLLDCIQKIFNHNGIRGLYYGFWPSMQYIFIYRGIYFGLFDTTKSMFFEREKKMSFIIAFLVAQIVTFTASLVSYPHDTVRRRLMMQAGETSILYHGVWDCTKKIWLDEGSKAFFRGMWANTIRGVGAAMILAFYNEFSNYM